MTIFSYKKAFTVIEFLIVIGLVSILTVFSLASYNSFTETKKLDNETNKVISILSLAQKRAIAGDVGDCSDCTLNSYSVAWSSPTQITLSGSRNSADGDLLPPFGSSNIDVDQSNKNITYSNFGTITFSKLTGAATGMPSLQPLLLINTSTSQCKQITISATGIFDASTVSCP